MLHRWKDVVGFPDYSVSNYGEIHSDKTRRTLRQTPIQYGVLTVMMWRDGKQNRRSVATLVAKAFVPIVREDFNTPIHLDGNRANCRADNLMWRSRPFAVAYHRDRLQARFADWKTPFEILETGERFNHITDAAMKYGVREVDLIVGLTNGTAPYLLGKHLRFVKE